MQTYTLDHAADRLRSLRLDMMEADPDTWPATFDRELVTLADVAHGLGLADAHLADILGADGWELVTMTWATQATTRTGSGR